MTGMRKWVVAGLAVVVICTAACLLDRPRTVDYHKKKYLEIVSGSFNNLVRVRRYAPESIANMYARRQEKKLDFHWDALLKLGYLQTRWFVVTNWTPDDACRALSIALTTVSPEPQFVYFHIGTNSTNEVGVTVARDEMARWEKVILELDVPQTGK
jgi:hypothetical protein